MKWRRQWSDNDDNLGQMAMGTKITKTNPAIKTFSTEIGESFRRVLKPSEKNLNVYEAKMICKKYYFFKKLSVSTVFSGWQICIWLTSIAIQIFKYTANFAMEASWTFYSLPLWGSWILCSLFFWLIIVNRNMDKGVFTNAGKVCGQLFLWLGLFLWLKLSFGKQV